MLYLVLRYVCPVAAEMPLDICCGIHEHVCCSGCSLMRDIASSEQRLSARPTAKQCRPELALSHCSTPTDNLRA